MPDQPDKMPKAMIINLKTNKMVVCQFNPNEYTIAKQNSWTTPKNQKGSNVGTLEFGGGQPATLTLKLFFDTSEKGVDVRHFTEMLWEMMLVDKEGRSSKTKLGQPPPVMFMWGKRKGFKAVITKITQKFVMFLVDGTPVRATLDVSFKQFEDEDYFRPQNPTSRSAARKIWIVLEGQTLEWIAYQEYGDPAQWRHIAATNKLTNPRHLEAGQVLNLVPLP